MLVDTSVWVDHFRNRNAELSEQLEAGLVWSHPFVIGELACGSLSQRRKVLTLLAALPSAPMADHAEVMEFVETRGLYSEGLGWIDLHLLLSARIVQLPFWTLDTRLAAEALALGLQRS